MSAVRWTTDGVQASQSSEAGAVTVVGVMMLRLGRWRLQQGDDTIAAHEDWGRTEPERGGIRAVFEIERIQSGVERTRAIN